METQDQTATDAMSIESDALKANLLETATDEVTVDPSLAVLGEIVGKFRGLSKNLDELLYERSDKLRSIGAWLERSAHPVEDAPAEPASEPARVPAAEQAIPTGTPSL